MAMFKDLKDTEFKKIDTKDFINEEEMLNFNQGKYQREIEALKDNINVMTDELNNPNKLDQGILTEETLNYLGVAEKKDTIQEDKIKALIQLSTDEMNKQQFKYDYMMSTTQHPILRTIKHDVAQVFHDVVEITDEGDIASFNRLASVMISMSAGAQSTHTLKEALVFEGMVSGGETIADVMRMKAEGEAITPGNVLKQYGLNLGMGMAMYGVGKGFKYGMDFVQSQAMFKGANKVASQVDEVGYDEAVYDAINKSVGVENYAQQTIQVRNKSIGAKFPYTDDAYYTGGSLDLLLTKPTNEIISEIDSSGKLVKNVVTRTDALSGRVKVDKVNLVNERNVLNLLDEEGVQRFKYTKVVQPKKPMNEEEIIALAKAMQQDPKIVLSMDDTLLDSVGSNYTMRNINKKRIQWLLEGRPELASQSTERVLEAIRLGGVIDDYEVFSPQFREVIDAVRKGEYSGITEVGQVGINEANIENLSYDVVKALDTHYKMSFKEMNATIGEYGGNHGVNNMLDLLEYGDKKNLNLVHMMYDPRNASEPWLRELMYNLHNQISTYRRVSGDLAKEFELDSDVVETLAKYGIRDEVFIKSPFVNQEATTRLMTNTELTGSALSSLHEEALRVANKQFVSDYSKQMWDLPLNDTWRNFMAKLRKQGISPQELLGLSNKKFKKKLQSLVGVGAKDQKQITDFHAMMRRLSKEETKNINDSFKALGRDLRVAQNQLERLPRFMSKETLMGEGFELLGGTSDDLTRKITRTPWSAMSEVQRQGFNSTIKPDMDATFKPYNRDADEWVGKLKVSDTVELDTRSSSVKDLWEAEPRLKGDIERTAWYLFEQKQNKMGEILIERYGKMSHQGMFDMYAKKYGLPNITVNYISDPMSNTVASIGSSGGVARSFTINKANFDNMTLARQMSVIRHEIEHVIDNTKYGMSAPFRGNPPGVTGNTGTPNLGKRSVGVDGEVQFKFDPMQSRTRDIKALDEWVERHYMNTINEDTNLDEMLTYFYDGHFYNYATDTFEPSYVQHNKKYMDKMMNADDRYWDFLEDTRRSTEYNGRELNMNELMHNYFETKDGFEDFMLTHGGGRGVASGNIMNTVKGDAEIRALNMTRNQFLASMSKENLLKMQKGGLIGHMDATGGVGKGVKLDADMVHMYKQLGENLRANWKNDRLTKFAGERFISKNMFSSITTNMILGNGGIKQTLVAPYQMVDRLMMGGKVAEGMNEMFKQIKSTVPNYVRLNAYNFGNMLESFHILQGKTDAEGIFMMNLAKKMQKFGNTLPEGVEGVEDLFLARQMMHEMFDSVSGITPENPKVKSMHKVFSRQLSTQEFYDTSANYKAKGWVLNDFKDIGKATEYTQLTELQQRLLGKGGYLESNWREGRKKLMEYMHKDGFDFELATANERDIANMFNTGVGYYNRTDVARKMTKVSAKASDFRYLMRTTIGLGVDSWREINTLTKGGILMPVNTLSKDGATTMLQRAGFMGISSGGALLSYKGIRSMEKALKERDLNALRWDNEIREMEFSMGQLGKSSLTLFEMTGMGIYLADPRSLTIVGAGVNTMKSAYTQDGYETIDNIFRVGLSAVIGSTMMSRWAMLTGSDAEKEAKLNEWWNSGQGYRDVKGNYNKHGMSFTKKYIENYNNSTKVMKSF